MPPAAQLEFALESSCSPSPLPEIRDRLLACYGPQQDDWRFDPVTQLVNAILSSRTRDEVSLAALVRLRRRYASWDLLSRAEPEEIEPIIRPVTYADRKARNLPRALRMIVARTGSLHLDFLADWPVDMAIAWLLELPDVGNRNAAAVLNFSTLRMRALSVNTHLLRVSGRLGLLPSGTSYADGYRAFMRLVPDGWHADHLYEFHWLMKLHGQRVCRHAAPDCRRCSLRAICRHPTIARSTVGS